MKVVYSGHEKVLMTDFNGKRYCFEKNIPVDVPPEIYNHIILSGHINAGELHPVFVIEEKPISQPIDDMNRMKIEKEIINKKKGEHRK